MRLCLPVTAELNMSTKVVLYSYPTGWPLECNSLDAGCIEYLDSDVFKVRTWSPYV